MFRFPFPLRETKGGGHGGGFRSYRQNLEPDFGSLFIDSLGLLVCGGDWSWSVVLGMVWAGSCSVLVAVVTTLFVCLFPCLVFRFR